MAILLFMIKALFLSFIGCISLKIFTNFYDAPPSLMLPPCKSNAVPNDKLYNCNTTQQLLVMFSTWIHELPKTTVHENTMQSWVTLRPDVMPMVFSDSSVVNRNAFQNGWRVSPIVKSMCNRIPILGNLFESAQKEVNSVFYGYANSDIIFDKQLNETLFALAQMPFVHGEPVLIVGRRTNVDFTKGRRLHHDTDLKKMAVSEGSLMIPDALDYFIVNSLFPWEKLPDIVIGRPGVDSLLLLFARNSNVTIIDATNTILGIHQTTEDGNYAGHNRWNADCNLRVATLPANRALFDGYTTRKSTTDCIRLYTDHKDGRIVVTQKPTLSITCFGSSLHGYLSQFWTESCE